jgi:hypothetical protein
MRWQYGGGIGRRMRFAVSVEFNSTVLVQPANSRVMSAHYVRWGVKFLSLEACLEGSILTALLKCWGSVGIPFTWYSG